MRWMAPSVKIMPALRTIRSFAAKIRSLFSAIPLHGPAQAFFEINSRFIAQCGFSLRDVGERVLDVAAALRSVVGLAFVGGKRLQQFESFVQRDPASGGDVKNFSRRFFRGSFAGQQVRRDGIIDVGEVAALFAVTV